MGSGDKSRDKALKKKDIILRQQPADKPVSLKPLELKDALGGLLAISQADVRAIKAATAKKKPRKR